MYAGRREEERRGEERRRSWLSLLGQKPSLTSDTCPTPQSLHQDPLCPQAAPLLAEGLSGFCGEYLGYSGRLSPKDGHNQEIPKLWPLDIPVFARNLFLIHSLLLIPSTEVGGEEEETCEGHQWGGLGVSGVISEQKPSVRSTLTRWTTKKNKQTNKDFIDSSLLRCPETFPCPHM